MVKPVLLVRAGCPFLAQKVKAKFPVPYFASYLPLLLCTRTTAPGRTEVLLKKFASYREQQWRGGHIVLILAALSASRNEKLLTNNRRMN